MPTQVPLVIINGEIKQLPTGDTLPTSAIPAGSSSSGNIDGGSAGTIYTSSPTIDGGAA